MHSPSHSASRRGDRPARPSTVRKLIRPAKREFPWVAPNWPESMVRPAPDRHVGADYDTDWARRYPVRLLRAVLLDDVTRPLTHLLTAPMVRGDEMLELVEPPAIFVANHASHVDTAVLLSVLPPRVRHNTVVAAAADHFFDRQWKAHLWAFALAAIPIDRHRVNRRSADLAADLLEEGWNLLIYPEGGRSHDGWFGDFKGGAAYLAKRSGRPILPIHLEGTFRVLPRGGSRLRRGAVTVTFGAPIRATGEEDARVLATRIEQAISVLADESGTDFWSARRRAASGSTPSARGPDASPWRRAWALPTAGQDFTGERGRWAVERPENGRRRTGLVGRASRN